jgi:triacylglycerol lipase
MRHQLGTLALLALLGGSVTIPAATADSPALTEPRDELAAATHCDLDGATRRTVLLVHGTGSTPQEAWGWNYSIALRHLGYGVCTVTLPNRATVNLGRSAQYVAYAARVAYRHSDRKIAIMGHSQGGLLAAWVVRFWPDVARHTADLISLSGPVRGTQLANTLCAAGECSTISWQHRQGSRFVRAFNRAAAPRGVAQTSIGTRQDEIVFPQPQASTISGGTTIMVQSLCPGRVVDHGLMLADAAVYALVLDALQHRGPARLERLDGSVCSQTTLPGADPTGAVGFANTLVGLMLGLFDATQWVTAEPAPPAYAR